VPISLYIRMRDMIVAAGKWPATGENGLHSASQLLLVLGEQANAQINKPVPAPAPEKSTEAEQ
jgi:hypothetical protein